MHVEINTDVGMMKAHEIIDEIERRIVREGIVSELTIHIDPVDVNDDFTRDIKKKVEDGMRVISDKITLHDFRLVVSGDVIHRVTFDITVPYDFDISDGELKDRAKDIVKLLPGSPEADIYVDRS